jgi:fucose 4-O-acetylase-like acetyltransferase
MFGHTAIGPSILKYSYIFNMPGFLFLSGYFFNTNKYLNYKEFFKAKAKAILIPYLGLSIISIIFYKFYYQMPMND